MSLLDTNLSHTEPVIYVSLPHLRTLGFAYLPVLDDTILASSCYTSHSYNRLLSFSFLFEINYHLLCLSLHHQPNA
jgi:hypothetical protein